MAAVLFLRRCLEMRRQELQQLILQKCATGDTTKRSGDTKDRRTRAGSETEDERAADGREEANGDRGPIDRWD